MKIYKEINEYIKNLILWSIKYIFTLIWEIKIIEEIEINEDFKYITKFEYQKIFNIKDLIKWYYKNFHDWNISKDNIYILSFIDILKLK